MDIKNLCHDHIIKYKALFLEMNNKQCHLVMEYLPFPNLLQIKIQTETVILKIFLATQINYIPNRLNFGLSAFS